MAVIQDLHSSPLRADCLLGAAQLLGNLQGPLAARCNEKTRGNGYKLKFHLNTGIYLLLRG